LEKLAIAFSVIFVAFIIFCKYSREYLLLLAVGDSIYDAMAAKNARMDFIGVASGYNKKETLLNCGALKVLKSVNELTKVLQV